MTKITDKISGLKYILYSKNQIVLIKLFCSIVVSDIFSFFLRFIHTFMVFSIKQESGLKLDFDKNVLSILNVSKFSFKLKKIQFIYLHILLKMYNFRVSCFFKTICIDTYPQFFSTVCNVNLYPLKKLFNLYHKKFFL